MPPAGRRMEEGVSAKVTAAAVLCRGAAGGAAGALLYDGGGAVGGRAHDGLTLHFTPLATDMKNITKILETETCIKVKKISKRYFLLQLSSDLTYAFLFL